jgi:hypothetical protein
MYSPKVKALSQISKLCAMHQNLKMGLAYTNEQYSALSEIDKLIALISRAGCFTDRRPSDGGQTNNMVFMDSLHHLSKKTFSNIPLFGIGDDPPVRIHLNLKRGPFIYTLKPIPLFSAPGFSSFFLSGFSQINPGSNFIHLILEEILTFMIKTDANSKEITTLINEVKNKSMRNALFKNPTISCTPEKTHTFLNKLIQRISFA